VRRRENWDFLDELYARRSEVGGGWSGIFTEEFDIGRGREQERLFFGVENRKVIEEEECKDENIMCENRRKIEFGSEGVWMVEGGE